MLNIYYIQHDLYHIIIYYGIYAQYVMISKRESPNLLIVDLAI